MNTTLIARGLRAAVAFVAMATALPAMAADYASIAWSPDGKQWGWAVRDSQALANKVALAGCNEGAPNKDCKLSLMKAVVRARGTGREGLAYSDTSVQDASRRAVEQCGAPDCKVDKVFTEPGFVTIAGGKNPEDEAPFYVTFAYRNSDTADKDAVSGCAEKAKGGCRVFWSGVIAGRMETAAPSPRPAPVPTTSTKSCRPNTPTVRCSSQCTNGHCVVTYENGCKLRVQVNAQFDPFTNQWKYPAPSC